MSVIVLWFFFFKEAGCNFYYSCACIANWSFARRRLLQAEMQVHRAMWVRASWREAGLEMKKSSVLRFTVPGVI